MGKAEALMAGTTLVATDTLRQMNFPRVHKERLTSYFVTFSVAMVLALYLWKKDALGCRKYEAI